MGDDPQFIWHGHTGSPEVIEPGSEPSWSPSCPAWCESTDSQSTDSHHLPQNSFIHLAPIESLTCMSGTVLGAGVTSLHKAAEIHSPYTAKSLHVWLYLVNTSFP